MQRSVTWCPELGVLRLRTWDGREHFRTPADWLQDVMSDSTTRIITQQLIAFAQANPNAEVAF